MTKNFAMITAGICLLAAIVAIRAPTIEQVRACRDMKAMSSIGMFRNYAPDSLIGTTVGICREKLGPIWYMI